ncbi:AAA-ATPase At2g18193-like isoform X2 [Diospyros lotus]|uniref:AAA-ATPase At2g18193-like isoform X2 n=1 Tax=Diospyros lotus TaxID=55363 RepID=UPI00225A5F5E|nr:AAA-ATPase At2g18193-like isoform X2 [Diospyros lotus]
MAIFSLSSMPSASSVLSSYTSFQASAMLVNGVISEVQSMGRRLIPKQLREKILSKFQAFTGNLSSQMTLVFPQYNNGLSNNEIFQASEIYLQTKIGPSVKRLKVSKEPGEKGLTIRVNKGEKIIDTFQGIELVWQMVSIDKKNTGATDGSVDIEETQQISIELSFHETYKDKVLSSYLPLVLRRSKDLEEENKVVKLHSPSGSWNLDHPSTFQTLAMDPALKEELMADLDRFVRRRQFYQQVGKVWKRGYLLYGPPGTGKSSLIAAMANYLKFHVYDLELTSLRHNSDLRRALLRTTSRSIIVIEDIDCSADFESRRNKNTAPGQLDSQLTLSGLLNFADGIWSNCGDGRIIVFTTNHKDRLDPALLRPGRMDLHIHMSYCTADGFRSGGNPSRNSRRAYEK